jgi:hypothetical protein
MMPPDLSTVRPPSTRPVRPSLVLYTRSPIPATVLIAARHAAPATHTPRDKQTRFSKWNKDKKIKQNYPGFEFKPRQVNDSSQSNQGTDHLISQIIFKWFRFSILRRPIIHDWMSSTTRREVATTTPTSQTTISIDMVSDALWIVPSLVLLNCVCVAIYYLLLSVMICAWGGVIFRFFNIYIYVCVLIFRRLTIANGRY